MGGAAEGESQKVSRRVEEGIIGAYRRHCLHGETLKATIRITKIEGFSAALFFKLKEKAFQTCKPVADAYAQCCSGRTISMAWACRSSLRDMSNCLGQQ